MERTKIPDRGSDKIRPEVDRMSMAATTVETEQASVSERRRSDGSFEPAGKRPVSILAVSRAAMVSALVESVATRGMIHRSGKSVLVKYV